MSNHNISHGKTIFDIFNMINPNCYQAFIIQSIIENKKEEAVQYCDELKTAIEYYKWDASNKSNRYIDCLICESEYLQKWQKLAIIYIMSNSIEQCKNVILDEIKSELEESKSKSRNVSYHSKDYLKELYNLFGFEFE